MGALGREEGRWGRRGGRRCASVVDAALLRRAQQAALHLLQGIAHGLDRVGGADEVAVALPARSGRDIGKIRVKGLRG